MSAVRWSSASLRRPDFERARLAGTRVSTRLFTSLAVWCPDRERARLGITVTRKVGKAVRRNRIKRLVREWFRARWPALPGCDLVVIAKRDISVDVTCGDVVRDLDGAWRRLQTCRPG